MTSINNKHIWHYTVFISIYCRYSDGCLCVMRVPHPKHPKIPPSCVCCCQGNLHRLAIQKQDLITSCQPPRTHPVPPPPSFISTSILLSLSLSLHNSLISFHLPTTPTWQKQEKCGCLTDRCVRRSFLLSALWLSPRHLSIKIRPSESVWSSWAAEPEQSDPRWTVITRS